MNLRTRVGWYLAPNIFRALADGRAAPGAGRHRTAASPINIYGRAAERPVYADHFFMGGGQGASAHGDGKSGLLYPTSAANTSVELMESRAPVLVLEKSFVTDSGGAGEHRGGLGQRVRVRRLVTDGQPTLVSVYPEGVGLSPEGLFGGRPGGMARGAVHDRAGKLKHDCGTGELVQLANEDDVIEMVLPGGAGYGDPRKRRRTSIETDIAEGCITPEKAKSDYGYSPAAMTAAE